MNAYLQLALTPGLSLKQKHYLLSQYPINTLCDRHQCAELPLPKKIITALQHPLHTKIDQTLRWLEHPQHNLITLPELPPQLREITSPPLTLYIWGNTSTLFTSQLAMVGSRNPTPSGKELAQAFSYRLSATGLTITSGLAIGIDTASHQGALAAHGRTLAILGSGLNQLYPKRNIPLAEKIAESGAVLSAFPLDTPPQRENFPQRNRLISGLSLGTLVVEATIKSGSLITARYALEQNREVFAIPGSPLNILASGCNHLIQQGAKLLTSVDDLQAELANWHCTQKLLTPRSSGHEPLDQPMRRLLECVGFEVTAVDMIAARAQLAPAQLTPLLLTLELKGRIKKVPGGYARL